MDVGPGLFTGLRVGVATAKALAQGLGIGVLGVSSLDILAAGALALAEPGRPTTVVSVVDARRGEVFVARYRFGSADAGPADDPAAPDPDGVRAGPPELLTPEGLVDTLSALDPEPGGRVLVVGDGAVRYLDTLAGVSTVDLALAGEVSSPSPLTLGRLAARRLAAGRVAGPPIDLVPDYRREADAKINWEQRLPPTVEPTG